MNIYIETYGCSANQNNSEIIAGLLEKAGCLITKLENSDCIIINSCVVKGPTEAKILAKIKKYLKEHPKKKIIVTGCIANADPEKVKAINKKIILVGLNNIKDIVKAAANSRDYLSEKREIKLCIPKKNFNKIIDIVQISEGCLGECSYCFTKFAKGELFAYPKEMILQEIKNSVANGCKEIWITSQDSAAYPGFIGLLRDIVAIKGNFFVRIGMMNPNHVLKNLNDLIEIYKSEKVFKFLHLPVQSGSNKVLKDMNRFYKKEDFIKIIDSFKKEIPLIHISTDIIVGFPTETEKDFEKTFDLVKKVKPGIVNISRYWPMPKTKAASMKQLDIKIIQKRSKKLHELVKKISLEDNKKFIGWSGNALVDEKNKDGSFTARNIFYKPVIIDKAELGKMVKVKISKAGNGWLR